MRRPLARLRIFSLALLLILLGSSLPALAGAKSALNAAPTDSNLYRYANNNPVNYIDPKGLYPVGDSSDPNVARAQAAYGTTVDFNVDIPLDPNVTALMEMHPAIGTIKSCEELYMKVTGDDQFTMDDLATFAAEYLQHRMGGRGFKHLKAKYAQVRKKLTGRPSRSNLSTPSARSQNATNISNFQDGIRKDPNILDPDAIMQSKKGTMGEEAADFFRARGRDAGEVMDDFTP